VFQNSVRTLSHLSRGRVGEVRLVIARLPLRQPLQGAGRVRLCASGGKKKPPKGFEKFYESAKSKGEKGETPTGKDKGQAPAEAKDAQRPKEKAEQSETKTEAPKESPKEGKKRTSSSGKGQGANPDFQQLFQSGKVPQSGLVMGLFTAFAIYYYASPEAQDEITIQEMLREYLVKGYVERIQIVNKTSCRVELRGDAPGSMAGKTVNIQLGTPESFEAKLAQMQNELGLSPLDHVPIQYVTEVNYLGEAMQFMPSLLILIPLMFALRSMSGGLGGPGAGGGGSGGRNIFNIGKAIPTGGKDLKSKVKFADVAGLNQAKEEVVEFVDFLKDPTKYEKLGAKIPKGGLLVGPPGTGKTLLAKAVAGEADCPFYSMSGSDFIEMFVGVGPSRVRDLFQQARSSAPSIVFIDEIDAVGRKRGSGGFSGGNDERENTLNQLLVEMDGFSSGTGVVVLAGTNRADILDPALTRPGRFDRQIPIDKPDLTEREAIFLVHLRPINLATDLKPETVAKRMSALTPGFAGSDIANICNEAAIFGARRNADAVEMQDFERATERVIGGLAKHNSVMSPEERKTVAFHECGHAIAGWFLEHADPLLKVSIVPRSSGALGFAQYLPEEIALHSKEAILDKIAVSLGGRAAEELFIGRISTGASDDLDKVTRMAYSMVTLYGMNPAMGLVSFNPNSQNDQFYKPYSEETGRLVDREVRELVSQQYDRVKALLTEKTSLMKSLADELFEKETLVYTDLRGVLGERPYGMKKQFVQFVQAGMVTEEATSDAKSETSETSPAETPPAESKVEDATQPSKVAKEAAPTETPSGSTQPDGQSPPKEASEKKSS